jgi:hypothetical protein
MTTVRGVGGGFERISDRARWFKDICLFAPKSVINYATMSFNHDKWRVLIASEIKELFNKGVSLMPANIQVNYPKLIKSAGHVYLNWKDAFDAAGVVDKRGRHITSDRIAVTDTKKREEIYKELKKYIGTDKVIDPKLTTMGRVHFFDGIYEAAEDLGYNVVVRKLVKKEAPKVPENTAPQDKPSDI